MLACHPIPQVAIFKYNQEIIMNTATQNLPLIISDTFVHQDAESRYCLNDVHKAAGENPKHQPSNWLRLDNTKELIAEIDQSSEMRSVEVINGGKSPGTYVVKELVYAYAMWISPAFSLKVIRAYDALVTSKGYGDFEQKLINLNDRLYYAQQQVIGLLEEKVSNLEIRVPRKHQADEIAAALRCRKEGFSYRDIGELLKRSKESVSHMVRKAEGRS
jgi:hypothetical protein